MIPHLVHLDAHRHAPLPLATPIEQARLAGDQTPDVTTTSPPDKEQHT